MEDHLGPYDMDAFNFKTSNLHFRLVVLASGNLPYTYAYLGCFFLFYDFFQLRQTVYFSFILPLL